MKFVCNCSRTVLAALERAEIEKCNHMLWLDGNYGLLFKHLGRLEFSRRIKKKRATRLFRRTGITKWGFLKQKKHAEAISIRSRGASERHSNWRTTSSPRKHFQAWMESTQTHSKQTPIISLNEYAKRRLVQKKACPGRFIALDGIWLLLGGSTNIHILFWFADRVAALEFAALEFAAIPHYAIKADHHPATVRHSENIEYVHRIHRIHRKHLH